MGLYHDIINFFNPNTSQIENSATRINISLYSLSSNSKTCYFKLLPHFFFISSYIAFTILGTSLKND